MPRYYYIPQNAWGLVSQAHYAAVAFFSTPGGPCRPVSLWCGTSQRGAFTHFDGNAHAVTPQLAEWLADDNAAATINIYASNTDDADAILSQLDAIAVCNRVIMPGTNPDIDWACSFGDTGPLWHDADGQGIAKVHAPGAWSDYWPGAPDWNDDGSTFTNVIIHNLTGFFANYNGRYYFDFH